MKKIVAVMLLLFAITVQAQTDPVSQATTTLNADETTLVQQINTADTLWDTFWTCSLSNLENQILGMLPVQCPADGTIITNAQVLDAQKLSGLTALTVALDYINLNSAEQALTTAQIGSVSISLQNLQQLESTDAVAIQPVQSQIQTLQQQNTLAQGLILALQAQASTATTQIQILQGQEATSQAQILTLQGQVATLQTKMNYVCAHLSGWAKC